MESFWFKPELSDKIMANQDIYNEMPSIVSDIVSGRIDITQIVENMAGVLTNKDVDNRVKGMCFFTKLLKELPNEYLSEMQVKFISKFYVDRLKDSPKVIPSVLEGYVSIMDMKNFNIQFSKEFFETVFKHVSCQGQLRQDRYHLYLIISKIIKDIEFVKQLGSQFILDVALSIDGERDPRNLLFLFSFLKTLIQEIPLGCLEAEMFDVLSCYYPIDFQPSPDNPVVITREDLSRALAPCLCAIPQFAGDCLVLLIEKLDSSYRVAKIDSLQLLIESCKTFRPEDYIPFLKTLWSSIHREITNKNDEEIKMVAHEALSALVARLATSANTDQSFENFVKGIVISMQTAIAESTSVGQFVQASKVLLTTANASKASCELVAKIMIPATVAYYGFQSAPKLQIASIEFLGDIYDLAKHWEIIYLIENQLSEIPQICLTAVSESAKEYQMAGFKTLMRAKNVLSNDLVLPFVQVLIHNVQYSQDRDLLKISVETIHTIARKYPELIMNLVVKGKCDIDNLTKNKSALQKRLSLLSNLASIDDFTKVIIEEMLKVITDNDKDASKVVAALSESISNSNVYTEEKVNQIESDHGLIDSILAWLYKEIKEGSQESLNHGYNLIATTISNLPDEKQQKILTKYTKNAIEKSKEDEIYFSILECLYSSIHQTVFDSSFQEIMSLSLNLSLSSENEIIRTKANILIAHFLNKAEHGQKFELLYEYLKGYLSSCNKDDQSLCPKLISLYGWLTRALILRSSDLFLFWLQKIMVTLSSPDYCMQGAEAIRFIMTDSPDYLTAKHHCRISLLYKQRMFMTFSNLNEKFTPSVETKDAYLLSWAYVLAKTPKVILNKDVNKVTPLVIDSLEYDNKDLLTAMIDILCHFVQMKQSVVADSLQTILPRLIKLTKYVKSMDVRIKSLQCLYDIANSYPIILLLPYKQDILMNLAPSLDDKKRLVRNVAVKARTRWFVIGSPNI